MEEGLHLTQCQQGRLLFRRFREVHHHTHMRTVVHSLAVDPLTLVFRHPGPTLLTFSRMEVGIEHREIGAILIKHLVSLHVRMIDGNRRILLEGDTIETVGQPEDTVDYLRQLEIGAQHLCIDVITLQLQLMGIEAEIPRF